MQMSKMKDKLIRMLGKSDTRKKIIIVSAVVGIILIMLSELNFGSADTKTNVDTDDYNEYISQLSTQLETVISSIDGVGECNVMLTLQNTKESVYAENSEKSENDSSTSDNNEYVIYDSENGDSPLLIKENFPKVAGVAVVCEGGDNILVKEKVIECVCALFNISASRVSVAKLNTKGDN